MMNNLIEKVDKKLDEYMAEGYPESIFKSMKYTVTLPGKRLRPVMCLEACRIMGGNIEDAMPTACAIEMLHAQSLIHDDLPCMDNDDFRRGKPSNHKVFGEAIAVLAGDALLSYAPQTIIERSKLPAETVLKVLHEFVSAAGAYQLIGGQVVDIESEGGGKYIEKPAETLKFIHTNKTAVLFKLALKTGAIIAGATKEQIDEMEEFGQKFGLAFQIYDDIMDEISTFEELGKTIGKDKESGKLTYVSLNGLDKAKEKVIELTNDIHKIIDKYNSEIFNSITEKIISKIV
ncbi:MAG: polyprenyl synthetase family protein [Cyanobacteria bacterium RUI128]|nr:polyprenyl synthetase family protein [Cyanobacteria bacterium RUI128]